MHLPGLKIDVQQWGLHRLCSFHTRSSTHGNTHGRASLKRHCRHKQQHQRCCCRCCCLAQVRRVSHCWLLVEKKTKKKKVWRMESHATKNNGQFEKHKTTNSHHTRYHRVSLSCVSFLFASSLACSLVFVFLWTMPFEAVRVPDASTRIYKDECVLTFLTSVRA